MAAADSSSGEGLLRPYVPQSDAGVFYRVTADNILSFDFPTRDMAEAFAADYGPGCQISREPCSLAQQRDIEANYSPAAILDDLASAIALPVIEAAATDEVSSPDVQTAWIITHESETIFTNPDSYVCQMVRDRLGYGVVEQVELQPGETMEVSDQWTVKLRELLAPVPGKRRPVASSGKPKDSYVARKARLFGRVGKAKNACDNLSQASEPPVPVFRFDERWLTDDDADGDDDCDSPAENDPTPAEIAERCRQIQSEWSMKERRSRRTRGPFADAPAYTIPVCRAMVIGGAK